MSKLDDLRRLHRDMLSTARESIRASHDLARELGKLDERWDVDAQGKAERRKQLRSDYQTLTDTLKTRYDQLDREWQATLAAATASHLQTGGVEAEMKRAAAWNRLRPQLDAVPNNAVVFAHADKILQTAAQLGDTDTLAAARRELPAYLATRGETMPPELTVWLDVQAGPPEVVDARLLEVNVNRQLGLAQMAVGQAAHAASKFETPAFLADPDRAQDRAPMVAITEDGADTLSRMPTGANA